MQFLRSCILDVSQHHIRRFPATCLHDGESIETGDHHVLGGADAHGMAGEVGGDCWIEAGALCGAFDKAAEDAVYRASPLPVSVSSAGKLFNEFREFNFIFKPVL